MGVTLIFPGQGAQYVGMGKNLNDTSLFDSASSAIDFDLKNLCFEGPIETLTLTKYTQPAIVTHSVSLFKEVKSILDKRDISIDQVLGHSVGEYSALVAAGALSFEDAIKAVHNRGIFMQEATPEGAGKMYAIVRVPKEEILKACAASSNESGKVMPANFNEPMQTVISGDADACDRAVKWLEENFEKRHMAIPLKVSAPFHSSLMMPAQNKMEEFLNTVSINENEISYISNIDAKLNSKGTSSNTIKDNLVKQISGSVQWTDSISSLDENTIFIEVGPGKVLTGLNKKINKAYKTFTIDSEDGLTKLEDFLNECNL
ncbi:MAG: ACP S-malonyltransferase [Bacteriovoracaceae bacterium]|jgi:[acyl-carrier-protein] S-malonyltransferase|nr:ACP S-malonyltransferase [Bacteriovoracaceae bacterium]